MIISIEGNIGSGKTTLIRMLRERFQTKDIVFVKEPVDEWEHIKDSEGKTMLELFYGDPKTHAFPFQMMAYITRLKAIKDARQKNPRAILVMERCLQSDAEIFAKMLKASGDISDVHYKIYQKWAESLSGEFCPNIYVYVRADPSVSRERIRMRERGGESGITIDYLTKCHQRHEDWLMSGEENKVIVFDSNESFIGDKEYKVDKLAQDIIAEMVG